MDARERIAQRKQRRVWAKLHAKRQGGRCLYCRTPFVHGHPDLFPTFDHKVPTTRGGAETFENGCACCHLCNSHKGDMTAAEFIDSRTRGAAEWRT